MKPWIRTYSGKNVNPLSPTSKDICIEDIAHALAQVNRFAGHAIKPVSVAQHSVYVSRLCSKEHQLQGLLHDASEAYIGDVTKWIKEHESFAYYRMVEQRLQTVIFRKFGCKLKQHPEVDEADKIMVRFEATKSFDKFEFGNRPGYGPLTDAERKRVGYWQHWSWFTAEEAFLSEFRDLD